MNIKDRIYSHIINFLYGEGKFICEKCGNNVYINKHNGKYLITCPHCDKRLNELENRNDYLWREDEPKYGTRCLALLENNYGVKHLEILEYNVNFNHEYWKIIKWKEIIL